MGEILGQESETVQAARARAGSAGVCDDRGQGPQGSADTARRRRLCDNARALDGPSGKTEKD